METRPGTLALRRDARFRWLLASCVLLGVFEVLALAGWHLPGAIGAPLFAAAILAIGWQTIWHGLQALARLDFRSINLLMVIAVVGAFYLGKYEEAAIIIVLFSLGERLEEIGIERSRSAIETLVDRTPKTVAVKGRPAEVSLDAVVVGDIVLIRPGDMVPLDAEIVSGASSVDESPITGEPLPADKRPGDRVFAGTLNLHGSLEARVVKVAADSTLAKIIEITLQATKTKARTQRFIERFATFYTPAIVLGAVLTVGISTLALGAPFEPSLAKALALLVIACPCALVISTPISIYAAIGNASTRGALIKGGRYVEAIGRVKVIAMDKTRTLTRGKPKVREVRPFGDSSRDHLLACAAGIESYSEHPLAQSIVEAARDANLTQHRVENFVAVVGKGAKADCLVCHDRAHLIGKLPFISGEQAVSSEVVRQVDELQSQGRTCIVVSSGSEVEGVIAVTDEIKPESKAAVAELHRLGVTCVMVTGDHRAPAQVVATEVGIAEVRPEQLPEDKAESIKDLGTRYGAVAMVGDGVNDAPALALASVGISMGAAGSDTAIETSSIAILNDNLLLVPFLVRLGRRTIRTIVANTTLAIVTKLVFVVLAVIGASNLAMAVFADVGVTVLVILNSLRLLRYG